MDKIYDPLRTCYLGIDEDVYVSTMASVLTSGTNINPYLLGSNRITLENEPQI